MGFWLFLALVSVMGLFPDIALSRILRLWLVEKPATFFNQLTWKRLGVWSGLLIFLLVAAVSAPELMVLLVSMGDTAFAFELWMLISAAGIASGATGLWRRVRQAGAALFILAPAILAWASRRVRARKARRKEAQRIKPPSEDPEPNWAMLPALAA